MHLFIFQNKNSFFPNIIPKKEEEEPLFFREFLSIPFLQGKILSMWSVF